CRSRVLVGMRRRRTDGSPPKRSGSSRAQRTQHPRLKVSHPGPTIPRVPVRVVASPYGRAAAEALRAEIARAKQASPLAPVTAVVPGNSVGVATRRLLASGELGPVSAVGAGV